MSDLISRSALIKKFEDDFFCRIVESFDDVIGIVEEAPTAYDIDKVVEELESFAKLSEDRWTNGTSKHAYQEHKCWVKAIEIVKQGGVDDDVCEWKIKDACYTSSIKHYDDLPTSIVKTFTSCPYCSKKIKVVE